MAGANGSRPKCSTKTRSRARRPVDILVELDYPHEKKLSEDFQQQNKALSEHYKIEGFPTILMMDAGGQVIAKTGYRAGGPEEYVKHLADFTAIYENVVKMKGAGQGPGARPRQAARPVR